MDYASLRPVAERSTRPSSSRSPESHYWRKFRAPVFVKELAPITSIHFVPPVSVYSTSTSLVDDTATPSTTIGSTSTQPTSVSARQKFAVTTGARVQIYSMRNSRVSKTISRFKDVARSANFRSDGRLMVAGDDSGLIQLFDTTSRAILRSLRGHSNPVHVTRFSPNGTEIMSASDDRTVRLWDLPEQKAVHVFEGHEDYVRGGCAMTMAHGVPVEDVLVYPTGGGGVALSVGGPVMKVWDLMMGGRCMASISNHQKTITSLALSVNSGADYSASNTDSIGGMRILTGGLDHLVKVYDPAQEFKVTHTMRYPSPILSMAISPDESHIAVGMADGTLCVRKRDVKASELERREAERAAMNAGAYEFFSQGTAAASNQPGKVNARRATDDIRVDSIRKRKLQDYDRFLKAFRYGDALDAALRKRVAPSVTFGLILELIHRSPRASADGLRRAVAGRDDVTLEPVLRFLLRHAANANYVDLVCDTLNVIVDTYASVIGQSPLIDDLFGRIWAKVADELRLQRDLMQVRGSLEMILAGTALGASSIARTV
ncbi:hypothetical protein NDA10_004956 [Ustilago hordei]|nr:hypothetical protein NDA10_004956 [Ustilago hordei]